MKCVAVSDIHLRDVRTPAADLLIVAGDMTMRGTDGELLWFEEWLTRQPQTHKVWISGNHDLGLERDFTKATDIADRTGTIYLEDSLVEVDGVRIWGSPITPWFMDWAFNRHRGAEIRKHWANIPENLDILVTHGPPMGYLDLVLRGERVGCEELLDVLENGLKNPPRYHVCGHLHEGYGRQTLRRADGKAIEVINASSCNVHYKLVNPPIEFEV